MYIQDHSKHIVHIFWGVKEYVENRFHVRKYVHKFMHAYVDGAVCIQPVYSLTDYFRCYQSTSWFTDDVMDSFMHQELADMQLAIWGQLAKAATEVGKFMKTDTPTEEYCSIRMLHVCNVICTNVVHCAATCRIRGDDNWRRLSTTKNKSYSSSKII